LLYVSGSSEFVTTTVQAVKTRLLRRKIYDSCRSVK
jgi:hypothetical protein